MSARQTGSGLVKLKQAWPKEENHGSFPGFKDFFCHLHICHRNVLNTHFKIKPQPLCVQRVWQRFSYYERKYGPRKNWFYIGLTLPWTLT